MKNNIKINDLGNTEIITDMEIIIENMSNFKSIISDEKEAIDATIMLNKIRKTDYNLMIVINSEFNEKPLIFKKFPECQSRLRGLYSSIALICGIDNMKYFDNLTSVVKTDIFNSLLDAYNNSMMTSTKSFYLQNIKLYIDKFFRNANTMKNNLETQSIFKTVNEFILFYKLIKSEYDDRYIIQILRTVYVNIVQESSILDTTFHITVESKYIKYTTSKILYEIYMFTGYFK